MYLQSVFAETDLAALDGLVARNGFVTLATVIDGAPVVDHLPILYHRDGERIVLRGHVARANPIARHDGRALVVVHGPDAYVSPSWYPDKEEAARVPTWNYVVAHLEGALQPFEDEASLAAAVDDLSRLHEARIGGDWCYRHDRDDHRRQLRGIVGFRIEVERVVLKFKHSQNHPQANQIAVAGQLGAQQREASRELAALIRAHLATESTGN